MEKKVIWNIFTGFLSFLIISTIIIPPILVYYLPERKLRKRLHFDKIEIQSDNDFYEKYRFPGEGTIEDPYLIENRIINSSNSHGILIKGTYKYFVIRNCEIYSANYCIYLLDVFYGTAIIEDNLCINLNIDDPNMRNIYGIRVKHSSGTKIIDNRIICNDTTLQYQYGIFIYLSEDVWIENNHVSYYRYALYIDESSSLIIIRNLFTNNRYSIDANFSNNLMITLNNFSKNFCAYMATATDYVGFYKNTIFNNTYGMWFFDYSNHTINGNLVSFCEKTGLILSYPIFFNVFENLFTNNYELVIYTYAGFGSYIHHNNFINNNLNGLYYHNLSQACSDSYEDFFTLWFDPNTLEGNYWSDLNWTDDAIYFLDYFENGFDIDPYPLENPVDI